MNSSSYIFRGAVLLVLLASGGVAWSADCNTNGDETGAASVVFLQGNGDFTCSQAAGDDGQTMGPASGFSWSKNGSNPVSWSASEQVDKIFVTRNGSGSRCLYNFEPGQTSGNSLFPTRPKNVIGCSDHVDDELPLVKPVLQLEKIVTLIDPDTGVYDCDLAADEIDVLAPTTVAYCFKVSNIGTGAIDPGTMEIADNMGTPDFPSGFTGELAPGDDVTATLEVELLEEGLLENNAIVTADYMGSLCDTCADDDTATVNVVASCDVDTQGQADATGTVVTSQGQSGLNRCGPKSAATATSFALLCDDSCELKPECEADPLSCAQSCKPSKNWTYLDNANVCVAAKPGNDKLPLCAEVLSNPANSSDCGDIKNPAFYRSNGNSSTYGRNPTILHFPSSGGGDSTGTIYCLLGPGETNPDSSGKLICPRGAFVF